MQVLIIGILLIIYLVYNLFRINLSPRSITMKGHAKAKHHMKQAEMHHNKAAKHHEMAKKAMGLAKDNEKAMAKKGDKKGSKYP